MLLTVSRNLQTILDTYNRLNKLILKDYQVNTVIRSLNSVFIKGDILPQGAASRKDVRGMLIYGKDNPSSYPENLTTYVKVS